MKRLAALALLGSTGVVHAFKELHVLRFSRIVTLDSSKSENDAVTIYYAPGCGFCARAKRTLDDLGVPWAGVDVGGSGGEAREALAERVGGASSVPQIFVGDTYVGGFDALAALQESGELLPLVESKGISLSGQGAAGAGGTPSGKAAEGRGEGGVDVRSLHQEGAGCLNVLLEDASAADASAAAAEGGLLASADAVASELQARALALFDAYVDPMTGAVDYEGLAWSGEMAAFVRVAGRLGDVPGEELGTLSKAFWINLYNALVMHGSVVVGHPAGPAERQAFFGGASGAAYRVGPFRFSLDDIEHGVLRGSPDGDARSFAADDPRRALAVEALDPRIHFALNCGARSCPPVKLFTAEGLEKELKAAAQAFVSSEVRVPDETGRVELSKLFEWYGADFGATDAALLRKLASYLPFTSRLRPAIMAARGRVLHGYGRVQLVYDEYSWERNDAVTEATK